jgi:hypothetical protein
VGFSGQVQFQPYTHTVEWQIITVEWQIDCRTTIIGDVPGTVVDFKKLTAMLIIHSPIIKLIYTLGGSIGIAL